MAKKKEKKPLEKKNWSQSFLLIGDAVINEYTFKLNEHSDKSDWIYNLMNLNIDCGEKYGKVSCEMMGGYGAGRDNFIYVHGKKDDGSDDFENQYTIDWDDRFNEEYLNDIGRLCFYNVGIEKDTKGNIVYKRFLSPYDMIEYLSETLEGNTRVKVSGQLEYSVYENTIQVRKRVNNIYLPDESRNKNDKFNIAKFTQTLLIDKYSVGEQDKEKCVYPISGYVLEKFKTYNGNDLTEGGKVKGGKFVPLRKTFEYEYDPENSRLNDILNKIFVVKKDISQITYEGVFVEGGSTKMATEADLTDDLKDLLEMGVITLEDALDICTVSGGKIKRMVLKRPYFKLSGDDTNKVPVLQRFDKMYTEDDFNLDYLVNHEDENEEDESNDESSGDDIPDIDSDDWLNNIV